MALSRLRIEAQKERTEEEKKRREAAGQTIGEASRLRQEAQKEQEAKKAAGIPTSLPTFSELRSSGSESLRNREILQSVSRNANRNPVTTQTPDDSDEQMRDANLKDILWNSLKQGYYNSRYGEESYDRMMGVDNEADKYRDILSGDDYRFRTDNAFEQAVSGAMTQIGQMARQYTNPRSLGMATAAGGAALLAGQAGPQVLAPEELLTVPGAMALGFQTGSAMSNFEIEGGLAYQEMLDLGVSPETARVIGLAVGGGNAALEALQLDELMDGLKVAKKTGGMDNAAGVIWDVIKKRFPGVANNVAQEVGQEGVTITGAQLGSKIDKGEWAYDASEVAGRLGDTALSSMLTFGALDVPGASMNVAAQLNANKQYSKIGSDYQSSAEDLVNEGLSFAPESEAYQTAQEVKTKMDAGEAVTDADLGRVVVANERTMQAEERLERANRPVETLEEVAAEAVQAERGVSVESDTSPTPIEMPAREAVSAKESVPYNVMATSNPVRQAAVAEQKKLGYGEEGMKLFREIAQSNSMDKTELMVRFDTPYQAGLTGLPMKDANLVNDFQIEAYNAGRMDYIARMAKDKQHKLGAVLSEAESGFDHTGAPKSLTQAERNFADFFMRKMGVKGSWDGKDGKAAYNAFYDSSTGGVTFAQDFGIDPKLMEKLGSEDFMKKVERLESERAESFIFYVAHEVATHVAMNRAPAEMRAFVNAMYNYKQDMETGENLARGKQTFYAKNKVALDTEGAIEEVVADAILDLYHGDVKAFMEAMYRIANGTDEQAKKGARTYKEMLSDFIKKLKAWARKLTGRENAEARANVEKSISELEQLRDMFEQAISTSMKAVETARQNPQTEQATGEIKNSIKGLATAAGLEASRDPATGKVVFKVDGKVVTKVTPAHIREKSGLGGLITTANENGFISGKEAEIQYKAAADIMNMIINTQDPEMVWAWVGSSMFSAIKSNADGQYGTTVDFTTVCRKTQDMITAMSKSMMKLKRGLTKDEVTKLQAELIAEGSSVPCPVCYVFSRWAGIGSVLDNMYRWQEKYDGYTDAQLNEQIATLTEKLGKGKARELAKLLREQDEEYDNLSFEKEKLALEKKQLTSKKKTAVKNNDARTLVDINNRLAEIDKRNPQITKRMKAIKDSVAPELAWLLQVRAQPDYATRGKVRANVLFNLDDAATFAEEFPLAWKYRTTRGPSAGKAILPYSDMRVGDMILGVGNTSADGNTAFANVTGKFTTAQKAYVEKAIKRARAQNLIGGQRFQSTSDFRYDYALDYLMAFWEAQAIGSKMQTYTKIVEFGDMVAAVGGDFNLSVMPRNKGYITLPNGKNQLVFSSVTGIDFEAAKRSNQMHDNGQLILVGINDQHILAALEDSEETRGAHIGFVIPYHASGASINEFIRVLVSNLGETFTSSYYKDYSEVQGDKERKNATAVQKRRNDLRTKLLRGKDGGKNWEPDADDLAFIRGESKSIVGRSFAELRDIERKALHGDKAAIAEYESWTAGALWDLYNKMWTEDGSEYGVRLNTAQAKSVMPHEYWNKTINRDQAYINGFLFRSYCYNLGLTPRFSGITVKGEKYGDFTDSKGYWKTLIDRPMYRNDGTYRDQQMVNMSRFNAEMLKADYAKANWAGYSVQEPDVMRATRAAEKFVANETGRAVDSGGKMKYSMKEGDSHAGENHQAGSRKYVDPASGKESARVREFYEEAERRGQTVRVFESANGKREGRRLGRFTEVTGASRSKIAAAMQQELSKLGIDAFVHEGDFELLGKSGEILSGGDAAVITHSVVGIKNDIDVEPKEAAGHEAYHFWKNSAMRGDYTDMVVDSLDWTSDAFKALYAHIDKKYFDGQYDMDNDDHFRLFNEELVADISGRLHNGEDLSAMLDNAQDVKVSWDELVAQNSGKQYSMKDADYLSAVERDDMVTAQRMVDEAAKAAGYPAKLYHGTPQFGFTRADVSKSDDRISFFATDSLEVAQTYSGKDKVKAVSDTANDDIDSIEEAFRDKQTDLCEYINRVAGYQSYIEYDAFAKYWEDAAFGSVSMDYLRDGFYEEIETIIQELFPYSEYYERMNDDDVDQDELYEQFEESDEVQRIYSAANDLEFIFKAARSDRSGNYQLYANTDNLFELDAKGKSWAQIPFDEYDKNGFHPYVNTRQAAAYAKAEGFAGVKISNVFDDGGRSTKHQRTPATVYIFFKPQEQVKSADPVTYDDAGNVIPLSKRFDSSNEDIRFSLKDEGETVTRGILIGDADFAYSEEIKSGRKKGETRYEKNAFLENAYKTGERIALVRSGVKGKFAAYATTKIGKPIHFDTYDKWRKAYNLHRVPPGSKYDWDASKPGKWYYPFEGLHVLDKEQVPTSHSPVYAKFADDGKKYSMKDSAGRELSKGQLEYFKDSKVRDENGRLLRVYHGSANDFTVFRGIGNSRFGEYKFGNHVVNYFTASEETAKGYAEKPDYSTGSVYAGYVNITKPYVFKDENDSDRGYSTAFGLKNRELREFELSLFKKRLPEMKWADSVEEVNEMLLPFNARVREADGEYELYAGGGNGLYASETFVASGDDFYDLFDDVELLESEIVGVSDEYGDDDYYYTTDQVVNLVIAMNDENGDGYDGVIIDNIFDSTSIFGAPSTDVITIKSSNQFKRADNLNPTNDPDIRYSLKGEKANLTESDKVDLQNAKTMKADGKSNEEIYKATGWYTQSDGKWRREFATSAMQSAKAFNSYGLESAVKRRVSKYEENNRVFVEDGVYTEDELREEVEAYEKRIRKNGIGSGRLPDFYDDEELYTAYPFLKGVRLFFNSLNKKGSFSAKYAEYSPKNKTITIDRDACIEYGVNVRGVLVHEIQHAIQGYEGFSAGTSVESAGSYYAYENTGGEIEARDVASRLRMTPEERRSNMPVQFSLKGEQAMRKEIKRIRTEGAKAGKSESEIENDIMAVVGPEYGELIKTYGEIKRGERASREIEVPRKTEEDRHVSQTIRTVLEAEATPDAAVPTIQQLIAQGDFSYDVITDKAAMAGAEKILRTKGYETALAEWISDVKDGKVSKANTAIGWALYNQAANAGDLKTAMTILDGMIKHQRNAAQAVQATRILKKLSPDAQLYGVKRSVDNLKEDLIAKYGKKAPDLEINEELARKLLKAKTDEERDAAMRELYQDIGKQIPASFVDKWNAWRYLAMLGNPRTHVRNVVGNLGFAPVVVTKDLAATLIESMVGFVSRGKMGRTKAMPGAALLKAAWDDYANVANEISGSGKYNDAANKNQAIEDGRVIFKTKPLEKARKANSAALEMEDMWFAKPHYAFALAQYCKAHGVTADQLRRGKALGNARAYAIKEAQKATYRDTNAFSETISELGRYHGDNAVKKGVSVVMEGILPFRKTPANILVRGLEYSPMGLVKGLTWDLAKVKKGDITAADAIDNIAAGLTGTGLLAFGLWAAAEGLIRGAGGDDEEEKKYEELQGHQAYALELPDGTSVTLDWLAPEALPVFIGVNLYEMARDNKGKSNLADILTAVSNVTEPLLEMSCLQSLNDLFDSVGYATSGGLSALPSALASAATSYLTQAFPTILGQAERSAQDVRMTTYTEKDNFLTSDLQYTLGKISAKIPGWDFQQIPYVDAWGRTESTGSRGENAANNFLNPAYTSQIETSAMEEELQRLYEATGEKGVLPDRAEKKFTVNKEDKHLTGEEYVKYATEKGQMSYDLLTDLTSRPEYRAASDEEKVEIVDMAYEYATAVAKSKVSDYKPTGWVAKAIKAEKTSGMDETEYMLYELALSVVDQPNKNGEYGGTPTQEEKAAAIASRQGLSDKDIAFLWDTEDGYDLLDAGIDMRSYVEYVGTGGSVNAEKLIDIHSKGIGEETYFDFLDMLKEVDQPTESGKMGSYTQDEAKAAIKAIPGLSRAERAALWQSVNKSWKAKNNPWR